MTRRLLASLLILAALVPPATLAAEAGDAPTRPEYVERLEGICKPGSEATRRAVRGMRADVRAERLRVAAAKVARARKIFSRTVASISGVPRPADDEATLARWFKALDLEKAALAKIVAALKAEDVARFQRVYADFVHKGNKANNVVVSFGFDYCAFKPSRFQ
jgi:hypothetical protein